MESTMAEAQSTSGVKGSGVSATTGGGKYLTFGLASEQYGLEILKVQEIIGIMKVTRIPKAPEFVRGVINLRGKVIPVVDLRLKFGLEGKGDTERTCIIVVEIGTRGGTVQVGIVVDSVSDVINILGEEIEEPPELAARADSGSILGMAKTEDGVKILLDIDRVLSLSEISALEASDF